MELFAFKKISFFSHLPAKTVAVRIQNILDQSILENHSTSTYNIPNPSGFLEYRGKISGKTFQIHKKGNAWGPSIKGKVTPAEHGTEVELKLGVLPSHIATLILFGGLFVGMLVLALIRYWAPFASIPFMFIAGIALVRSSIAYRKGSKKTLQEFEQLLEIHE